MPGGSIYKQRITYRHIKGSDPPSNDDVLEWDGTNGVYQNARSSSGGLSVYGDGSDGDVTISVDTSLSTNKTYNNLTIAAGVSLNANGYGIWVNGTLTFGDASSRIHNNGGDGGDG
ncbi:MAG: hypothetical protein IT318_20390, partial [Anaerolineales bacterium]|nr:hypothetical protein [Anaerolineales bacterium]